MRISVRAVSTLSVDISINGVPVKPRPTDYWSGVMPLAERRHDRLAVRLSLNSLSSP
ncbi:hypothetical protein J1L44_001965 [Salmonella enterica subsp. enterica serovar Panama]|nr:hypothetical protein [Salmonella enterica subsp. enterica serovar Panama]